MNRVVGSLPRPSRSAKVGAKKSIDAVLHSPAYAQAGWRSIERGALQSFGRMPQFRPGFVLLGARRANARKYLPSLRTSVVT